MTRLSKLYQAMQTLASEGKIDNSIYAMAKSFLSDKNRIAKSIAIYLRNKIEDFHVAYLSDDQMMELNPLIRNSLYSFLVDIGDDYSSVDSTPNKENCLNWTLSYAVEYLCEQNIPNKAIDKFKIIISDNLEIALMDLSRGGLMLLGHEMFLPDYWEDCVYIPNNME